MRIYYKIDNTEIFSDDLAAPLNNLANAIHYYMLESLKYKIMWSLRYLEEEIDKSAGVIIIDSGKLGDKTKVYAKGFDEELATKIRDINANTKF